MIIEGSFLPSCLRRQTKNTVSDGAFALIQSILCARFAQRVGKGRPLRPLRRNGFGQSLVANCCLLPRGPGQAPHLRLLGTEAECSRSSPPPPPSPAASPPAAPGWP